jgi:hypothetical protein
VSNHSELTAFHVSRYARVAGCLYLANIALGAFGEAYVRSTLIASDAQVTVANIAAAQGLWRAALAGDLLMHLIDVPLIVFFYLLLKPVHHGLALTATLLNGVQTAVLVANKLNLVVPLVLLSPSAASLGFNAEASTSLIALAARLHGYGFGLGLIFFGAVCVIRGWLMVQSGVFPKALGALVALAGISYWMNSTALLFAPKLADVLFPWVLLPSFIGELALALWLVIKGVDSRARPL